MLNGPNDPPGTGDTPEPVETPDNTPDVDQPDPQPAEPDTNAND
jgi:hypothetical protein